MPHSHRLQASRHAADHRARTMPPQSTAAPSILSLPLLFSQSPSNHIDHRSIPGHRQLPHRERSAHTVCRTRQDGGWVWGSSAMAPSPERYCFAPRHCTIPIGAIVAPATTVQHTHTSRTRCGSVQSYAQPRWSSQNLTQLSHFSHLTRNVSRLQHVHLIATP